MFLNAVKQPTQTEQKTGCHVVSVLQHFRVLFSDSCLGRRVTASLTRWRLLKAASVADRHIKRNMYHAEHVETKHFPNMMSVPMISGIWTLCAMLRNTVSRLDNYVSLTKQAWILCHPSHLGKKPKIHEMVLQDRVPGLHVVLIRWQSDKTI